MIKNCIVCNEEFVAHSNGRICTVKCRRVSKTAHAKKRRALGTYRNTERAYYLANTDQCRARSRRFYERHREEIKERNRISRLRNPERELAYSRKYGSRRRARVFLRLCLRLKEDLQNV